MTGSRTWSDEVRANMYAEQGGSYLLADQRFGGGEDVPVVKLERVKKPRTPRRVHGGGRGGSQASDSDLDPFWGEQGMNPVNPEQAAANQVGAEVVQNALTGELERHFDEKAGGAASYAAALRRAALMKRNRYRAESGLPTLPEE